MSYEKTVEIVTIIFDKLKYFYNKLKNRSNFVSKIDSHEEILILSEYMAFDYILQMYDLNMQSIEKALSIYELSFT